MKLLKNGYTILRRDATQLKIKMKTPLQNEWHHLKAMFANRHQLDNRMDDLLTDHKIIED